MKQTHTDMTATATGGGLKNTPKKIIDKYFNETPRVCSKACGLKPFFSRPIFDPERKTTFITICVNQVQPY